MTAYLRALRLERWPRSSAIFLGSAVYIFLNRETAAGLPLWEIAWKLVTAFLLTWGISTANYVLNEIVDRPYDIHHPTKRLRPLVSGEIKQLPFAFIGLLLVAISLGTAVLLFDRTFFLSLLTLLVAGVVYNVRPIRTKDIPFLDSISESVNNPIRFLIGWSALAVTGELPPVSVLVCWWAFGNFLMVAKRLSEFRFLKEKAGEYRISHRKYSRPSLVVGMSASALICLLAFLYFGWTYKLQSFFAIAPFLLVFFGLIFRKTLREAEIMEEPEKLFVRPKYALYSIFLVILFALAFLKDTIGR
ncbi:MAG: UbiA family prenyltransferase [Candidatus Aminicenantes bacterium]|nr:UbiA family prenyltransferase [Candidatus Aminicenantes bacterium]